jgi:hypothetical protein
MSAIILQFPCRPVAELLAREQLGRLESAVETITALLEQLDGLRMERSVLVARIASHHMTVQFRDLGSAIAPSK